MRTKTRRTKEKKINISRNDIVVSFFLILLFGVFLFMMTNFADLNAYYNGFAKIFGSDLQVYFLDVGQASATLVIFPNDDAMIIDTGSGKTEGKFAAEVKRILKQNGIKEIDMLLLTHPDEDHIGGAVKLLETFQVNKIYRPKVMSTSNSEIENVFGYKTVTTNVYAEVVTEIYQEPNAEVVFVEDEILSFGQNTTIQIFSCQRHTYSSSNAYSPYIYLLHNGFSFLFTGDATLAREVEFLDCLEQLNMTLGVDFLQIAHHGSKHNTSLSFVQKISPRFAFVSAGDKDYPNEEVVGILETAQVEDVFVTKQLGTIAVGVSEDFSIKTVDKSLDLPFILVAFCCVCFAWLKFIIDRNKRLNVFAYAVRLKFSKWK